VALEIHSSWCALAAVVNFMIPPYDPKEGTIAGYGYSVVIFLAKWADTIARNFNDVEVGTNDQDGTTRTGRRPGRVQFSPPFFTFTFAKRKSLIDSSNCNDYITIVSTGKCVNLPLGPLTSALSEKLIAARWNQVITSSIFSGISTEDCPFPKDSFFKPPHEFKMIEKDIEKAPDGSVKKKTLKLFKQKVEGLAADPHSKGPSQVVAKTVNYIGGCAELWGFLVMQNRVRPGDHFDSITIDAKWAHCTKLIGYNQTTVKCEKCPDGSGNWRFSNNGTHCKKGRKHEILTPKPGCLGCLFLASAIEAKQNVIWKQDSGITLRPYEE
jgi:hypothetical protein